MARFSPRINTWACDELTEQITRVMPQAQVDRATSNVRMKEMWRACTIARVNDLLRSNAPHFLQHLGNQGDCCAKTAPDQVLRSTMWNGASVKLLPHARRPQVNLPSQANEIEKFARHCSVKNREDLHASIQETSRIPQQCFQHHARLDQDPSTHTEPSTIFTNCRGSFLEANLKELTDIIKNPAFRT